MAAVHVCALTFVYPTIASALAVHCVEQNTNICARRSADNPTNPTSCVSRDAVFTHKNAATYSAINGATSMRRNHARRLSSVMLSTCLSTAMTSIRLWNKKPKHKASNQTHTHISKCNKLAIVARSFMQVGTSSKSEESRLGKEGVR